MRSLASQSLCLLIALAAQPLRAPAQRPPGADTMSRATVAESLKVLRDVRAELSKDPQNAALWYRRGMIAWALYDRDRAPGGGLPNLDWTLLGREADSSLHIANDIEPANPRYGLTLGQFYLGTGWIGMRVESAHILNQTVEKARRSGDTNVLAEALVEAGRIHWRKYDPGSFGVVPASVRDRARDLLRDTAALRTLLARDLDTADKERSLTRESLKAARAMLLEEFRRSDDSFDGEVEYTQAERYFREASGSDPASARVFAQLAMLLVERSRWHELVELAQPRINRDPRDAWAWLSLGLAYHRLDRGVAAAAAFDSGLKYLPPRERARLDNVDRVVRPADTLRVRQLASADRASFEQTFWDWADPMWSHDNGGTRNEFLARVVYAELRWSVGELGRRGADSDRGDAYIRYGAPDARAKELGGGETWWYDYRQMVLHFRGLPTYGTAYFTNLAFVDRLMDSVPARWDNVVRGRIDSLPVTIARFRAARDSVDVVFSSRPPVAEIQAHADVVAPVMDHFWLFSYPSTRLAHDSAALSAPGAHAFARRLALGNYLYRFEASEDGSLLGARAFADVLAGPDSSADTDLSGFTLSGFGISDVLLATSVAASGAERRWSDLKFEPLVGPAEQNSSITLVWENYDFGQIESAARYSVNVVIERKWQMVLNRIRARVRNSLAALVGQENTEDRVVFHFERATAYAPIILDVLTIDLAETPPGPYDLTLEITDNVTGKITQRTHKILIRE